MDALAVFKITIAGSADELNDCEERVVEYRIAFSF